MSLLKSQTCGRTSSVKLREKSLGVQVWPLFALGDGGGVPVIRSASLVRMQVYAALAYGARGLYYCAPSPP